MPNWNQSPLDGPWMQKPERVWSPEEMYGPMPAPPWADAPQMATPAAIPQPAAAPPPAPQQAAAHPRPAIQDVFPSMAGKSPFPGPGNDAADDFRAAQRALITERARQQYEQRFGMTAPGAAMSMANAGNRGGLQSLLDRVAQARQQARGM